ncbi:hypothetical protein B0I18_110179 [Taibaiella chishuiensis]|uniref:Uncharacterized protein n=1 Tax=Taibaiella chishuiensis TaxID=1434707 RepID=A0A2P8CY43_9BACT|nr:hypothetical protein B0I18_110179 [Taibaiella chishuiensis]
MKSYKVVMSLCLLFLLGTGIYFLATQGSTEANFETARGPDKGDRINGLGILFLFVAVAVLFGGMLLDKRNSRKTRYRK